MIHQRANEPVIANSESVRLFNLFLPARKPRMQEKMISCLAFLRERLYKPSRPRRKAGTASKVMER